MARRAPAQVVQRNCLFCEAVFTPRNVTQRFCTPRCNDLHGTREKSASRKLHNQGRTCADCPISIAHLYKNALRCYSCRAEHKRAQDRLRESSRRKYEVVTGRICFDCHTSIDDRTQKAVRCVSCSDTHVKRLDVHRHQEKRRRDRQGMVKHGLALSSKEMIGSGSRLERRDPGPAKVPTERKPSQSRNKTMPNYKGDWYPGWNGCYSNNLSPLAVELLKGETGRPHIKTTNQTMQSSGHDRVLRRPSNIPEDLVTIQVAEKRKAG